MSRGKMMRRRNILFYPSIWVLILMAFVTYSCEKWHDTEDVSHVSHLPEFELVGGEFMSMQVVDSGKFEEPGVKAFSGDKRLTVYFSENVDLTKEGVYFIRYYAQNEDGLYRTKERIIAVRDKYSSENDLSGKYIGTLWNPLVEMKVKKIDENGFYECEEILGYPGAEMPGRFVDMGDNELYLIHGEGFFGEYANSEGSYGSSFLSWTVSLIDEPYSNVRISVTWAKIDE